MDGRHQHAGAVLRAILGVVALGAALSLGGALSARAGEATVAAPTLIGRLADSPDPVAARGRVAEVFGGHFILDDGTGRALVDTGPRGEGGSLLVPGAIVTVQGRFGHGVLHAALLADAAGAVTPLRPEPGAHGPVGREGGPPPGPRDARRGPPPCGPDGMPPRDGPGEMPPAR